MPSDAVPDETEGPPGGGPLSPHLLNPVGRLWAFLVSVETRGGGDDPGLTAVGDYLGLEPGSPVLGAAIAAVRRMPERARAALAGTDAPPPVPQTSLQAALAEADGAIEVLARPGSSLALVRQCFGPATMATLKGTSAWLIGSSGSRAPWEAALEELRRRALNLSAAASGVPDAVSAGLEHHAAAVLDAVRLFPVTGTVRLDTEASRPTDGPTRPDVRAAVAAEPEVERALLELTDGLEGVATAT